MKKNTQIPLKFPGTRRPRAAVASSVSAQPPTPIPAHQLPVPPTAQQPLTPIPSNQLPPPPTTAQQPATPIQQPIAQPPTPTQQFPPPTTATQQQQQHPFSPNGLQAPVSPNVYGSYNTFFNFAGTEIGTWNLAPPTAIPVFPPIARPIVPVQTAPAPLPPLLPPVQSASLQSSAQVPPFLAVPNTVHSRSRSPSPKPRVPKPTVTPAGHVWAWADPANNLTMIALSTGWHRHFKKVPATRKWQCTRQKSCKGCLRETEGNPIIVSQWNLLEVITPHNI